MRVWRSCSLLSIIIILFCGAPAKGAEFTFKVINVDFPSFHADLFGCGAAGLNDAGVIVGGCNDRSQNSNLRAYLFDGSKFTEIRLNSTKTSINQTPIGSSQKQLPFRPQSIYQNAPFQGGVEEMERRLRPKDPKVRNLPNPQDVNNQGNITGSFFDGIHMRGFMKRRGTDLAVSVPGSDLTEATGINDLNQVVGDFRDSNGRFHSFVFENGNYRSIDVPFTTIPDSGASGINNFGKTVGCYSLCSRGFLFDLRNSVFTLIDVPGALVTQPSDINDHGNVVGIYFDGQVLRGFFYDGTGFTTIDAPGAFSTIVSGINNAGEIVGSYQVQNAAGEFDHFAFIAVPQQ